VTVPAIVPATRLDMDLIGACVRRFRLDDEDLRPEQFVVVREGDRVVAFGRIKPYASVHELGCVGVLEEKRGRGLGTLVVEELIHRFPTREVYITTDLPRYFERFGFAEIADPPTEIAAKMERVCGRLRRGVVAMALYRDAATPRS
jgi:N-acetylglutamate synthase-like GNAT family acetyltransferase